ncbi:MAG TPA: aldose 1-epimerase family protein [Jatrophihabitantaceae bacterium]|jgi:aldose 1-epimerase
MTVTGQQFPIVAGDHEVIVTEVGAGLRCYRHRDVDVTACYDADVLPPRCAGAVLVPWPNRLRGGRYRFDATDYQLALTEPDTGNAIHGLARWTRWTPVSHEPARVTLATDVVPQKGYPFEMRVEVTYALDAESGLTVTTSAQNTGSRRAPFGVGFHPYLSVHGATLDDTVVTVPARERILVDDAAIPVGVESVEGTPYDLRDGRRLGRLRMDDCFTGLEPGGRAEVRAGDSGAQLWFGDVFGYLQVFTPDVLADGVPAIAVEPMTCPADAFNSTDGLLVIDPGGTWTGSWGITPL